MRSKKLLHVIRTSPPSATAGTRPAGGLAWFSRSPRRRVNRQSEAVDVACFLRDPGVALISPLQMRVINEASGAPSLASTLNQGAFEWSDL
jgi:hypothetical protein